MGTTHLLESKPNNMHWGAFSSEFDPVLKIKSGDQVVIETISGGHNQIPPGTVNKLLPDHELFLSNDRKPILPGHILTGPIFIEEAKPGDVLEVNILNIELRQDWAWNMIAPLRGSLPEDFPEGRLIQIDLDKDSNKAMPPWGIELPINPFFGVLGVSPPKEWGTITSVVPQPHGGNLDIKELTVGTKLYFPIYNDGGMFSVGDGHALQGDGESCLSAAETALTGTFEFHLRKDMNLKMPRAETETHYISIGIDADLDDAAKQALREMISLITEKTNLSKEDAYSLISLAGDVRISQLVNINKGCHVMLPKACLHSE
ncbi:MAG: amidase [Alphaproteobacteria bacterium]|jgi:acetamidase/formamidase|nr:amidase [Alphaproteobacteria bacterium]PPR12454.1 MAG: Formamidase [Alphaproteobacteria bacterium MarineAlpha12_Bin1]|tara:strand:- start:558 stop:1508 length:951 start_codon:yes stop_codon:yes gene_type:complete